MDRGQLKQFFLWCSLINGALLALTMLFSLLAPDLVYATQSQLFSISREGVELVIYAFLALYKVLFLVFNLVPYIALRILDRSVG